MSEEPRKYYTVSQAAEELDVSRSTIWRWIGEGRVNVYRPGPRTVRIRAEDLEALVTGGRSSPLPAPGNDFAKREGIWAGYDPAKVRESMEAAFGRLRWSPAAREKWARDMRIARGQRESRRR